MGRLVVVVLLACAVVAHARDGRTGDRAGRTLFQRIDPGSVGCTFGQTFPGKPSLRDSVFDGLIVYGGGIAVGDLDADGYPDLVLGSYTDGVRIYRNRGAWRFDDVTTVWLGNTDCSMPTGITMGDIDGDGDRDLIIARMERPIVVLANDGRGRLRDVTAACGMNVVAQSIQATLVDYDKDGDLDCYVAIYQKLRAQQEPSQRGRDRMHAAPVLQAEPPSGQFANERRHRGAPDILFRNDGRGHFTDVTAEAGITDVAMGLSCTAADIDGDGWTDLYVSNDFGARDAIYMNVGGRFVDRGAEALDHVSAFSMGTDVADCNNDGRPDIVAVDMYPARHVRRISRTGANGDFSSYNPDFDSNQVMRNTLQLNRGGGRFSEIALMAGVAGTDWSWSALFFDADLDGNKDLFIANGYLHDVSDQDYVNNLQGDIREKMMQLPLLREPTFAYRNGGNLMFADSSVAWGVADTTASVGAAYADIDDDGDLDYIVVNIDAVPDMYRNMAVEQQRGRWLQITAVGGRGVDAFGTGVQVWVYGDTLVQHQEIQPVRGFMSSVDTRLTFGLGRRTVVDSVVVRWPDGAEQRLRGVSTDRRLIVRHADARDRSRPVAPAPSLITRIAADSMVEYRHRENLFDDFKRERLLPWRMSWDGPCVAVGDIDGNGFDDCYIGGAYGIPPTLLMQVREGAFERRIDAVLHADSVYEDGAALFFDADGDGDVDLYVASGGLEADDGDPDLQDRLYRNDGATGFVRMPAGSIPAMRHSTSALTAGDYDGDGDLDLFVGGRVVAGRYPHSPPSTILRNDGGRFTDVTDSLAAPLRRCGLVRSAVWTDVQADGRLDLVVVGEWMPICVFTQGEDGRFVLEAGRGLDSTQGFWQSVASADIDNDGDMDLVVGNIGWNTRFGRLRPEAPIRVRAADFDDNGSMDALITYVEDGTERLMRDRMTIFGHMPTLQRAYNTYEGFSRATMADILGRLGADTMLTLTARTTTTTVFRNDGRAGFTALPLPSEAQVAPAMGLGLADVTGDGLLDILAVGNLYGADREMVRHDAGKGIVLQGRGRGTFAELPVERSGFAVAGDSRTLAFVGGRLAERDRLFVFCNQGPLTAFVLPAVGPVVLVPMAGTIVLPDGQRRRVEPAVGGGYLQQTPHSLRTAGRFLPDTGGNGVSGRP